MRLDWTLRARRDLFEIWDYIYLDNKDTINADMVYARVENTANLLISFPDLGKPFKKYKIILVPKTQYTIVYKIMAKSVRIIRISHQKRKYI